MRTKHLRRVHNICVLAAIAIVAFGVGDARAAETTDAPRLYVASGPGYSLVFGVGDGEVSVLGLDATAYCTFPRPSTKLEPQLNAFFPVPTPLSPEPVGGGLIAVEGGGPPEPRLAAVRAAWVGDALVGSFRYVADLASSHCQTGGYLGSSAAVPFEAGRFEPVGEGGEGSPTADEPGIYFSAAAPLETLLRTEGRRIYVRGSLTSSCRFGSESAGTYPLFGSPTDPVIQATSDFDENDSHRGKLRGGGRFLELLSMSGAVGEESIAGFYSRLRLTSSADSRRHHRCGTGTLPFTAERYVPAVG